MNRVVITYILLAVTTVMSVACESSREERVAASTSPAQPTEIAELQLPVVPTSLREPSERAAYIVAHFWDEMDFGDTVRSHNRDFMEQNFVNYLSLFPLVDKAQLTAAVDNMLKEAAAADTAALNLTARIAYKYLYEPNSPMQNEEIYELFLQSLIGFPALDPAQRARYDYYLESIAKNRAGTLAADFAYIDRKGVTHTLRNTPATSRIMLLFFDPDCDHCKEVISQLRNQQQLNDMINAGELTLLAIAAEGDNEQWEKIRDTLPDNWIVGRDKSGIEDNDIYVLRAMPTIYLLDEKNYVILKDTQVNKVMDVLI